MTSLRCIMANTAGKIPTIGYIAVGIILVLAFIIGMVKGVRKVGWGGFYWALAGVGYIFAYKYLGDKNLLGGIFNGKYADLAAPVWAIVLAVACILVALIFYGVFGAILRPREVWIEKYRIDGYGFEYEMDDMDDRLADGSYRNHELIMKGDDTPTVFGRIAGGFMSLVNAATVLATLLAVFILVVNATSLGKGSLGAILEIRVVDRALEYIKAYALDFITVGIILAIAYKGYKNGFVGSARAFMMTVGLLAVIGFCFAVPFLRGIASKGFIAKLIERCIALFGKMKPAIGTILGKLTAGALMAIVAVAILLVINFLLKKLTESIEDAVVARVVDGVIASLVYLVVGAAVVALFWAALYLLDYCGVFYTSQAFNGKASLASECFEGAECLLKNFADKYLLRFKK